MKYLELFENYSLIQNIKNDVKYYYNIEVEEGVIKDYINKNNVESFDTVIREEFADYLSNILIGMNFPRNKDNDNYKKIFYEKIKNMQSKNGIKYI